MKINEIKLEPQNFVFNSNLSKKGSKNDIFLFRIGRAIPTTLSHLKRFNNLDVLNSFDCYRINLIFNRANAVDKKFIAKADFIYTKSHHWVRLTNIADLKEALKILITLRVEWLMSV
jgi:hypothetical protein